jgi:hypothetical protein
LSGALPHLEFFLATLCLPAPASERPRSAVSCDLRPLSRAPLCPTRFFTVRQNFRRRHVVNDVMHLGFILNCIWMLRSGVLLSVRAPTASRVLFRSPRQSDWACSSRAHHCARTNSTHFCRALQRHDSSPRSGGDSSQRFIRALPSARPLYASRLVPRLIAFSRDRWRVHFDSRFKVIACMQHQPRRVRHRGHYMCRIPGEKEHAHVCLQGRAVFQSCAHFVDQILLACARLGRLHVSSGMCPHSSHRIQPVSAVAPVSAS